MQLRTNVVLPRMCVTINIKSKEAGAFNRNLGLLQFLIVVK